MLSKDSTFKKSIPQPWTVVDLGITAALALIAFFLYKMLAQNYQTLVGFDTHNNVLFGLDQLDAMRGWVDKHKGVHPLVLLIVVPLCNVLASIAGTYANGLSLFCGLIGGATVATFYFLVRLIVERNAALALAAFFIVSMNQLFFASLADTYELAALSLMPSFILLILCVKRKKLYFPYWVLAGIFSFGITITSSIQTGICFCMALFYLKDRKLAFKTIVAFPVIILSLGVILSLIQVKLFPKAQKFYQPHAIHHELQYVKLDILNQPGMVMNELVKNFFIYSFVGQDPVSKRYVPGVRVKLDYYKAPLNFSWVAKAAGLLWLILFSRGILISLKEHTFRHLTITAFLCILSNLVLFSFFNIRELYLYTSIFSFITLLLMVSHNTFQHRYSLWAWWLMVVLMSINNIGVHLRIIDTYGIDTNENINSQRDAWRYYPGNGDPGTPWMGSDFDDSSWTKSPSGYGYGNYDVATINDTMEGS